MSRAAPWSAFILHGQTHTHFIKQIRLQEYHEQCLRATPLRSACGSTNYPPLATEALHRQPTDSFRVMHAHATTDSSMSCMPMPRQTGPCHMHAHATTDSFHVMHAHATTDSFRAICMPMLRQTVPCHACPCYDRQLPCHMHAHATTDSFRVICMPMPRQTVPCHACPCHDRQLPCHMHAHATTDSFRVICMHSYDRQFHVICMPMPRQTASVSYVCPCYDTTKQHAGWENTQIHTNGCPPLRHLLDTNLLNTLLDIKGLHHQPTAPCLNTLRPNQWAWPLRYKSVHHQPTVPRLNILRPNQ